MSKDIKMCTLNMCKFLYQLYFNKALKKKESKGRVLSPGIPGYISSLKTTAVVKRLFSTGVILTFTGFWDPLSLPLLFYT